MYFSEPKGGHSEQGSIPGQTCCTSNYSPTAAVSNKSHWLINRGQDELCLEKIEAQRLGGGGVDQRAMSSFLKTGNELANEDGGGGEEGRGEDEGGVGGGGEGEGRKKKKKRLK